MDKELTVTVIKANSNLSFEYNSKVYVKDLISVENATIQNENLLIDTLKLGTNEVTINYNNKDKKFKYIVQYNVVDTTPPLIWGSSSYTIKKGDSSSLVNKMMCGDNYDKRPNCIIEGEYNVNKVGEYKLKYVATDTSNNKSEKDFVLKVKTSLSSSSSSSSNKTPISEIISEHKNENTMIGIDVSTWQGDINWNKVKNDGVEFAIIRMGFGYKNDNEIIYDDCFKENIKNAKAAGIKVGLYFYSYAKSPEEGKDQAKWIINELNGEKLDLPIAFDWESWSKFNSYNISFTDLNNTAAAFIDTLEKAGYEGMLYGSCSYLERIWNLSEYDTWLAHYAKKTDYTKDYYIWQLSSTGKVNGIDGYVDMNVLYKK